MQVDWGHAGESGRQVDQICISKDALCLFGGTSTLASTLPPHRALLTVFGGFLFEYFIIFVPA